MHQTRESKFEALVYTENPGLAARCARAFAEFPLDWVMFYEPSLALDYLSKEQFDFVILDLDSAEDCPFPLHTLHSGANLQSVVLAVTSAPVDSATLELCYASRVFYPVRPSDIQEQLYRTVPLAERLALERLHLKRVGSSTDAQIEVESTPARYRINQLAMLLRGVRRGVSKALSLASGVVRVKHSLSVVAQERAASLLASLGMLWFVQEITEDFRGIGLISPPSPGPTYLIAVSLLLWLCAKHRRVHNGSIETEVTGW
jgi:hypothetical protein